MPRELPNWFLHPSNAYGHIRHPIDTPATPAPGAQGTAPQGTGAQAEDADYMCLLIDYGNYTSTEIPFVLAQTMEGDDCYHGFDPADLEYLLRDPHVIEAQRQSEAYDNILNDAVFTDGNGLDWLLQEDGYAGALFLVRVTPTDKEMEGIPEKEQSSAE